MTNLDKFIEVMNTTFGFDIAPDNVVKGCHPGVQYKWGGCMEQNLECDICRYWWRMEYRKPNGEPWWTPLRMEEEDATE